MNTIELASGSSKPTLQLQFGSDRPPVESLTALSMAYRRAGMLSEANGVCSDALELFPDEPSVHWEKGCIEQDRNQTGAAVRSFLRVLELEPGSYQASNNLGGLAEKLGEMEKAEYFYRAAYRLNPDDKTSAKNLGKLLHRLGDLEGALEILRHLNFEDSVAIVFEILYQLGRDEEYRDTMAAYSELNQKNLHLASLSAFVSDQMGLRDPYPFCPDPLDHIRYGQISEKSSDPKALLAALDAKMKELEAIWEPPGKTTSGGYQTSGNIFSLEEDVIVELKEIVLEQVYRYFNQFGASKCTLIEERPKDLRLTGWHVRMHSGGYQANHIHADGWLSGVVYLKTISDPVDREGALRLNIQGDYGPLRGKVPDSSFFQPTAGDIILFPSSLHHSTMPVRQDQERSVIAFDLLPA
jgi:tetratricopeptide (TPR) repeat protein